MAAGPLQGGRNTALYQQLSFLPTHTHRKRRKHKHACGPSTCQRLGSSLRAFLFRQRQRETEETQRWDCAPGCAGRSALRRIYWRCFVLFVGGWGLGVGGGRVGVFQLPATYRTYGRGWKRPLRVGWWARIGPGGAVAVTHADSPRCGFCLERRKRRIQAFDSLWQLYMRILLKHLTSLCIQFHVNLALWLPRQLWWRSTSTGNAQATTTGSSRQQEVTTDLKRSHGDIIPILDVVVRINVFFFFFRTVSTSAVSCPPQDIGVNYVGLHHLSSSPLTKEKKHNKNSCFHGNVENLSWLCWMRKKHHECLQKHT